MFKVCSYIVCLILIASCSKNEVMMDHYSEARYQVTITGKWQSPQFTVPAFVHYTTFAVMVHNSNIFLWQPGKVASRGVEDVAEVGNTSAINSEIDSMIIKATALSKSAIDPPEATGSISAIISCNTNFSYVSMISMLAPSPDWFTGLSNFNLYDGKKWLNDMQVNLYSYDAGTEEGDVFGYNNAATVPPQSVKLLSPTTATVLANGNSSLGPIATIRFTKL